MMSKIQLQKCVLLQNSKPWSEYSIQNTFSGVKEECMFFDCVILGAARRPMGLNETPCVVPQTGLLQRAPASRECGTW